MTSRTPLRCWHDVAPICLLVAVALLPLAVLPLRAHEVVVPMLLAWLVAKRRDPRRTVIAGLALSAIAGAGSAIAPLLGHALLGVGASLVVRGALAWGVALAGPRRRREVIAWIGVAICGSLVIGAPIGAALAADGGLRAIAIVATLAPLTGLGITLSAPVTETAA